MQSERIRLHPTRGHFLQLIDMGIDRMGVGYRSVPVVLGLDKAAPSADSY